MGKLEELECEVIVLRDLLRRAKWYTGEDEQSSPPTIDEVREFLTEVRAVLGGDDET
jgi:broad-specificity NMP kinase